MGMNGISAPPGWYPHPQMAGALCYWNGDGWTVHTAPARQPAYVPPSMTGGAPPVPPVLIGIGWTATLFLPIAGLVIGIVVAAKGEEGHGLGMILGSVIVMALLLGGGLL